MEEYVFKLFLKTRAEFVHLCYSSKINGTVWCLPFYVPFYVY